MYIGIDPDIKGGIAVAMGQKIIQVFNMPTCRKTLPNGKTDKKKLEIDCENLFFLINRLASMSPDAIVNIEHVHSMPRQGVASAFTFGSRFGMIYACALATGLPVRLISPRMWKKQFGLLREPKDASRILAIESYPNIAEHLKFKKDVGKADAVWIALA